MGSRVTKIAKTTRSRTGEHLACQQLDARLHLEFQQRRDGIDPFQLTVDKASLADRVSEAIERGSVQAINYFVANNYVGALKALAEAKNQKVLILPLEASSVIGAIAGVAEISREAFGDRGGNSAATPEKRERPATVPRTRPGGTAPSV